MTAVIVHRTIAAGPDGSWLRRAGRGCHTPARPPGQHPTDRHNRRTPPPRQEPVDLVGCPHLDGPGPLTGPATPSLGASPDAPRPAPASALIPAAGGTTHRRRAPARRSGREEARVLPVPTDGAQRASIHRSVRLTVLTVVAALVAGSAAAASPAPASAAGIKVVDRRRTGRVEHRELHLQRQDATRPRPAPTAPRCRDLQPLRDVVQGQGGGPGRQRPHLSRSRQRFAQPVRRLPKYSKDGLGLNARPATATRTSSIGASTTSTHIELARNAVVILNRLCYASGNSEWGSANPTKTTAKKRADNYGAASCGPARGPSSPRRSRTPGTRSRRSSRPTTRWTDPDEPSQRERGSRLHVHLRPHFGVLGSMDPPKSASTAIARRQSVDDVDFQFRAGG